MERDNSPELHGDVSLPCPCPQLSIHSIRRIARREAQYKPSKQDRFRISRPIRHRMFICSFTFLGVLLFSGFRMWICLMSKHRERGLISTVHLPRFMLQKKRPTFGADILPKWTDSSIELPSPNFLMSVRKNPSSLLALTRFPHRKSVRFEDLMWGGCKLRMLLCSAKSSFWRLGFRQDEGCGWERGVQAPNS